MSEAHQHQTVFVYTSRIPECLLPCLIGRESHSAGAVRELFKKQLY